MPCDSTGYFPVKEDCSLFFQCDHGLRSVKQCAPGTVYDPTLEVCNWPDQVSSCGAPVPTTEPSSSDTGALKPGIRCLTRRIRRTTLHLLSSVVPSYAGIEGASHFALSRIALNLSLECLALYVVYKL